MSTSATTPEIEEEETQKSKQTCRYYVSKYPEVDDLVMVKVKSIAEMGAYVSLLEYDNIEGMILLSELSRKRIRSVSKLIRVGRKEVVVVLRVDKEKGYIDLSKKRVSPEDQKKCEEKYTKSKTVHDIMRLVADKCSMKLEDLNTQITWPLHQKFGHAYDALKLAIADKEKAFEGMTIPKEIEEKLVDVIQKKLKPQPVKIRADIEVTCFAYEGIDAIKSALKAGEAQGTEESPIKITLIAPPLYVIITTSNDKNAGINMLNESIKQIEQKITENGGSIVVKSPPRIVSAKDEHSLTVLLDQLREQNKEVSGDEPEEEEYMTGDVEGM